jgi:hypothetical protein
MQMREALEAVVIGTIHYMVNEAAQVQAKEDAWTSGKVAAHEALDAWFVHHRRTYDEAFARRERMVFEQSVLDTIDALPGHDAL